MGQVLHGSATTTEAVRRAIQHSQESLRALAKRYGINPKTVAKWRKRASVADLPTGPKEPSSTVLSAEEEAIVVAFRRHTLLPLDDCLYALQPTIPHLTRSSLHRCLQRHGISRLPEVEGDKPEKKRFKGYPIGYFHIDIAEVQTEEGKLYLFRRHRSHLASSPSSSLVEKATTAPPATSSARWSRPCPTRSTRAHRQRHPLRRSGPEDIRSGPTGDAGAAMPSSRACQSHDIEHRLTKPQPSVDQRSGRADEPHHQGRHRQALPLRQPRPAPAAPR